MKRRTAWMVESNTDLTEGRGRQFPLHICAIEATAHRLAEKAYVMGSTAPIEPVTLFYLGGRWYGPVNVEEATPSDETVQRALDARAAAVAKAKAAGLSNEEIAAIAQ